MQRFYFHIWNGKVLTKDLEGSELKDRRQAEADAQAAAMEMLCDAIRARTAIGEYALKVEDEDGTPVCTARLIDQIVK